MKLDVTIMPSGDPLHDAEQIRRAEELGFDGAWIAESANNPFFPLTIAAKQTSVIRLGTQSAVAFPRSPMVTAQIAWDLARQTEGRFILGLGIQARAHIERRFSEKWGDPGGRMREYIESLRAIWNTFQTDARLRYRGEHYQFRLMAPFFNPGPISNPAVPIYLAGVNPRICQLAGETCQGLQAHAFHRPSYLREVVLPAVETGLRAADCNRSDFTLTAPVFIISGSSEEEERRSAMAVRERLAFYASTPAYHQVMIHCGWEILAKELGEMAREGQWEALKDAITDDILREFAIIAEQKDVYARIIERYGGLADRVCLEWHADDLGLYEAIAASRSSY